MSRGWETRQQLKSKKYTKVTLHENGSDSTWKRYMQLLSFKKIGEGIWQEKE